jgi:hypothetical protein
VPELGALDWTVVEEFGDLMTAVDQVNAEIERENRMAAEGAPQRKPIRL